jgi:hypothetical protein
MFGNGQQAFQQALGPPPGILVVDHCSILLMIDCATQ